MIEVFGEALVDVQDDADGVRARPGERASAWGPARADVERLLGRATHRLVETTQGG